MTPTDACDGQTRCPQHSVRGQRHREVFRAARLETTDLWQHRSQEDLISPDESDTEFGCEAGASGHLTSVRRASRRFRTSRISLISCRRSENGLVRRLGLPINIMSSGTRRHICSRRYASRSNRRARLRSTDPPTRRLTANPTREACACFTQSTTKLRRSSRLPRWNSA